MIQTETAGMGIPTYQIHNVMKIFSNRLMQEETGKRVHPPSRRPGIHRGNITAEGKRRLIATRVTAEIFSRLNRSAIASQKTGAPGLPTGSKSDLPDRGPTEFTYHVIDAGNTERAASLSVEDPSFLIDRLENLAADDDRET